MKGCYKKMKKLFGIKTIVFLLMILFGISLKNDFVSAFDGDVNLSVRVKIGSGAYQVYQYNSQDDNNLDYSEKISYDYLKHELTLNEFIGSALEIRIKDESVKDFTINVKGNNRLKCLYADEAVRIISDYNVNLNYKGDGTIFFMRDNPENDYSLSYFIGNDKGDITVDGPKISIVNNENNNNTFIKANNFTLKSGTIDFTVFPYVSNNINKKYISYHSPIVVENHFKVIDGQINITYDYPKEEDDTIVLWYAGVVIDEYGRKPEPNGKVNLSLPDELKDVIKLTWDYDIKISIKPADNKDYELCKDFSLIKGLSWDENTKTLTMDGYNGYGILIESDHMHNDVTIVVNNENVIDDYNLDLIDVDATFKGDGSLKIYRAISGSNGWPLDNYSNRRDRVIIDGPYIELQRAVVDRFEVKSGFVKMNLRGFSRRSSDEEWIEYEPALKLSEGLYVTGGTIFVEIEEPGYLYDNNPDIRIDYNCIFYMIDTNASDEDNHIKSNVILKDCVIYIVDKSGLFEGLIFKNFYNKDKDVIFTIKENAEIIYTKSDYIEPVNIDRFKTSVEGPVYYDGKPKTPKVIIGGLHEGIDYEVTYADNINIGKGKAIVRGKGLYTGQITVEFDIVKKPENSKETSSENSKTNNNKINNNKKIKDKYFVYRIISEPTKKKAGKVKIIGLRKKNKKIIKVKNVIKKNGKKYKVVSIAKKVFRNNKKITKVIIGKNVTSIGSKAFFKCGNLKTIIIKSKKLNKIGKKAFAGIRKSVKIKFSKKANKSLIKQLKKYKIIT